LFGFGVLFFEFKRRGEVIADERDQAIANRSMTIALSVVWIATIFAATFMSFVYEAAGAIPVTLVQGGVWATFLVLVMTRSIATLVQYHRS
jgi:hypothetical protein